MCLLVLNYVISKQYFAKLERIFGIFRWSDKKLILQDKFSVCLFAAAFQAPDFAQKRTAKINRRFRKIKRRIVRAKRRFIFVKRRFISMSFDSELSI